MQIEINLSSERQVSCRASTTSLGDRSTNGLPSVTVVEGGRIDLTGLGVLTAGAGCLRGAVEYFLKRRTHLLHVNKVFGGKVYSAAGSSVP